MSRHGYWTWFVLVTADGAPAAAFYEAVLGWSAREEGASRVLVRDGVDVAGIVPHPVPGLASHWVGRLAVASVTRAAERVKEHGGRVIAAPFRADDGGLAAVVADPAGATLWLTEGGAENPTPLRAQLFTPDPEAAEAFYRAVLEPDGGADVDPEGPVGGIAAMPAGVPPLWCPWFPVDDVDVACDRAAAHGATRVADVEAQGRRVAVFRDPVGAYGAFVETVSGP